MAVPTAPTPSLHRGDTDGRLGLDQPAGWWPTTPRLKSFEAAGFAHVQVRVPSRSLLSDRDLIVAHASALRESLTLTGLHLILHAPDDLLAGTDEHDHQLEGALTYAALAGADMLVYHGARLPIAQQQVRARLADEERSLRRLLPYAGELGVRIAIENLAPVYPEAEWVSHNPHAIAALIRRLESEHAGMCLDLGHAHIVAGVAGCGLLELVEPVLEHVILFHVHDNFGVHRNAPRAGSLEPVRLDLHLAPGAGTIPWRALTPLLARHPAPLQLEVPPAQRPEPATLAILTREVLGLKRAVEATR
jgi:sugar phosphate isomerase/epimerase